MFDYAKKIFRTLFLDKNYIDPALEDAKKNIRAPRKRTKTAVIPKKSKPIGSVKKTKTKK